MELSSVRELEREKRVALLLLVHAFKVRLVLSKMVERGLQELGPLPQRAGKVRVHPHHPIDGGLVGAHVGQERRERRGIHREP